MAGPVYSPTPALVIKTFLRILESYRVVEKLAEDVIIALRLTQKTGRLGQKRTKHEQGVEPGPPTPGLQLEAEALVEKPGRFVFVVIRDFSEGLKIGLFGTTFIEFEKGVGYGSAFVDAAGF